MLENKKVSNKGKNDLNVYSVKGHGLAGEMDSKFKRHDENMSDSCGNVIFHHHKHLDESIEDTNQNKVHTHIPNCHELETQDILRQQCPGNSANSKNNGGQSLENTVSGRNNEHNVGDCHVNVNHNGEWNKDATQQTGLLQVDNNEKPGIVNLDEKQYEIERISADESQHWQGINLYDNETGGICPGFYVDTLEKREGKKRSAGLTVRDDTAHSTGDTRHNFLDTKCIRVSQKHGRASLIECKIEFISSTL